MARVSTPPTVLKVISTDVAATTFQADPAGSILATGANNGIFIPSGGAWHAEQNMENIVLRIQNLTAGAAVVSVKAGAQPLAISGGQGDLAISIPATSTKWVGPFDSARFAQADGSLAIDTTVAVTITAFAVQTS